MMPRLDDHDYQELTKGEVLQACRKIVPRLEAATDLLHPQHCLDIPALKALLEPTFADLAKALGWSFNIRSDGTSGSREAMYRPLLNAYASTLSLLRFIVKHRTEAADHLEIAGARDFLTIAMVEIGCVLGLGLFSKYGAVEGHPLVHDTRPKN